MQEISTEMDTLQTYELETQYFGFLPTNVIDLVINAVNDYVLSSADSLKTFLLESNSSPVREEPEHVWKAVIAVVSFVQDAVDKYFDKFELYCFRNIFKIPEHLNVPGDIPRLQSRPAGAPELQSLIQQVEKEMKRNRQLREELRSLQTSVKGRAQVRQSCEEQIKRFWNSHEGNLLPDHIVYLWEQAEVLASSTNKILASLAQKETLLRKKRRHSDSKLGTATVACHNTAQEKAEIEVEEHSKKKPMLNHVHSSSTPIALPDEAGESI
eukprot:gene5087-6983_t